MNYTCSDLLTDKQRELQALIESGKVSRSNFALDISSKLLKSQSQHDWVQKLIDQAQERDTREQSAEVLDTSKIVELFNIAKTAGLSESKLKVRLSLAQFDIVSLSAAKSTSRNPGAIYVKRNGNYVGKVTPAGKILLDDQEATALLKEFAAAPEVVAAKHGKLTDQCSFCGQTLSDARSIEVGYGPICAKHWGLKWGI